AMRLVQGTAVELTLRLADQGQEAALAQRDPFNAARRFERRSPALAAELERFLPGYARTPEAARAILAFLERRWPVSAAMAAAIRALA
ncbi:MAG TPA: hypothetical protein VLW17_01835, partial [Thermoanaerobaculaceae bacterium]|nr:hypothetical protein [Thermoanaerobaculaceae bacterium]